VLAVDPRHGPAQCVRDPDRVAPGRDSRRIPADRVLGGDAAALRVDHADGVLIDPRQSIRCRDAAHAEGEQTGRAGEHRDGQERCRAAAPRRPVQRPPRGRWTGGRRRRGPVERLIVRKDRVLEPLKLGAGLDADLLNERAARLPVGLQRLGLAPRAVQRQHPLGM
jgi:hypothetical protein